MLRINKVTTKTGDGGKTLGLNCTMLSKGSHEVDFLGKLDALNCAIGNIVVREWFAYKKMFEALQHQIFDLGAMFYKGNAQNCEELITKLEEQIETMNQNLPELTSFLLPGKNKRVVALHLARSATRDAERAFWKACDENKALTDLNSIGIYLNRLSDLIFVVIRKRSKKIWQPMQK